jgi:uncharacterized protein YbbC (DUF1343 family)
MVMTGLEKLTNHFPDQLVDKRIGLLCHAASITSGYVHSIDCFSDLPCRLSALFGPQHGMFGQTQDNMVEWEGFLHPVLKIPVYSLYGKNRKPSPDMLSGLDALVIDLQDVGTRPYTYIWTMKLCIEACTENGVSVWVLDRPNPIGGIPFDGPMLNEDFFSFVGGAVIPMCHRLTIGEIALLLQKTYFPSSDLNIVWMDGWKRSCLFSQTGLPWIIPSPNMPTFDTALVYPGMVLLEATNISEGRGTTRPFEIFGAPYIKMPETLKILNSLQLPGCIFREHGFIPTFQKWSGEYCNGFQIHVTDPSVFIPVFTAVAIISVIADMSGKEFVFKGPPYEYETGKMPFDILSGSEKLRKSIEERESLMSIRECWVRSYRGFNAVFREIAHYPEV